MINEKHIINISEVGLSFLGYVHLLLLIMWAAILCIDHFCQGIFHGTPIAIEIFVMGMVLSKLTDELKIKRRQLIFLAVVLVIGFGFNVTHLVFSAIELSNCTTNLCLNTFWVLAVFVALLGGLVVLEIVEFVTVIIYYQNTSLLIKSK